jgi:hypothetical protein
VPAQPVDVVVALPADAMGAPLAGALGVEYAPWGAVTGVPLAVAPRQDVLAVLPADAGHAPRQDVLAVPPADADHAPRQDVLAVPPADADHAPHQPRWNGDARLLVPLAPHVPGVPDALRPHVLEMPVVLSLPVVLRSSRGV